MEFCTTTSEISRLCCWRLFIIPVTTEAAPALRLHRDSEDTLLLILKETLRESGIEADLVQRTEPVTEAEAAANSAAAAVVSAIATGTVQPVTAVPAQIPADNRPGPAAAAAPVVPVPVLAPVPAPAPPAPVPIVVTAPAAAAMDAPPLPGGASVTPAPGVPSVPSVPAVPSVPGVPPIPGVPPTPAAAVSSRAVGGRPLQILPTSGGPVGMDPTVERREGSAPPPPPPTAGFRRS